MCLFGERGEIIDDSPTFFNEVKRSLLLKLNEE